MKSKLKYFLTIQILIFCISVSIGQQTKVDSLKIALKSAKHDTSKIMILLELVENIDDANVWSIFNEQAFSLSKKLTQNSNEQIKKKGKQGLADAYNNFGYLSNERGDITEALNYF